MISSQYFPDRICVTKKFLSHFPGNYNAIGRVKCSTRVSINKLKWEHLEKSGVHSNKSVLGKLLGFRFQKKIIILFQDSRGSFNLGKMRSHLGNHKAFSCCPFFFVVFRCHQKLNPAYLFITRQELIIIEFITNKEQNKNAHRKSQ